MPDKACSQLSSRDLFENENRKQRRTEGYLTVSDHESMFLDVISAGCGLSSSKLMSRFNNDEKWLQKTVYLTLAT